MLAVMTASLPPGARELIQRVYAFAMALQSGGLDTATVRAAMLITSGEAFLLLDCAQGEAWEMFMETPVGAKPRTTRFNLAVSPRPGMAWAKLFGVTLIIDSDVLPGNVP
jgi:hypothetical protein